MTDSGCATGPQAMLGMHLGLDESRCQARAAGSHRGSLGGRDSRVRLGFGGEGNMEAGRPAVLRAAGGGGRRRGRPQLCGQLGAHPCLRPGHHSPWIPIMCSRMRTLSARIFKASRSCCTPSPCGEQTARVRAILPQCPCCPRPSRSCLSPSVQQLPPTLCWG